MSQQRLENCVRWQSENAVIYMGIWNKVLGISPHKGFIPNMNIQGGVHEYETLRDYRIRW